MKKYILMLIICIISFMIYTNNVFAKTFTYNPSIGYAKSGNQAWTGYSINNFDFSGATWKTIYPNNSPSGVMFEYGLPSNVKGVLSFSILVSGQFKSIPIVTGYYDGNYFTCNNSGVPTYNTGDEGYYFLTYYCENFDSSGRNGYNNLQFQFNAIYDPVTVFGVTNFMVVNDDINVALYEMNTKLSSIISSLSGLSSQIGAINSSQQATTDAINSQSQQQHQDSQAINNSINSDNTSGAESGADDLVNNSAFNDNTGLSAIIGLPLTFVNNLGNSCQPISLTIPYMDYNFQLPCIQSIVNNYMPALVVVIKVIVNGLIIYWILLDIFKIVKSAKNPEEDRIEVLDL